MLNSTDPKDRISTRHSTGQKGGMDGFAARPGLPFSAINEATLNSSALPRFHFWTCMSRPAHRETAADRHSLLLDRATLKEHELPRTRFPLFRARHD